MPARPDLSGLRAAIAACREAGCLPALWLRDDDAVAPTPALDRLLRFSQTTGLATHLAVIPADATEALGAYVTSNSEFIPVVHGLAHQNHASAEEKKAEFGPHRTLQERLADAQTGLHKLRKLFGNRLCPAFVPPWNRMADDMAEGLATAGFTMISTYGPRSVTHPAVGMVQINTHIDPIDWRGTRGLVDPDLILARLSATLAARARGETDGTEPLGLLTHHLVQDAAIWDFCEWLVGTLLDGGATPWRADGKDEPE